MDKKTVKKVRKTFKAKAATGTYIAPAGLSAVGGLRLHGFGRADLKLWHDFR